MLWTRTSSHVNTLLLTAVLFLRDAVGSTVRYQLDHVALVSPPMIGNLSCHVCYYSMHGGNCLHMTHTSHFHRRCQAGQYYCKVERYVADGAMQTFTRQCAETCEPGCRRAGRNYVVEICNTCCQEHFCNNNNRIGAAPPSYVSVMSQIWMFLWASSLHAVIGYYKD